MVGKMTGGCIAVTWLRAAGVEARNRAMINAKRCAQSDKPVALQVR
jgi:hypothetical protein